MEEKNLTPEEHQRIYGDPNKIVQFFDYTNGEPDNSHYIPNLVPGMLQPLEDILHSENDAFLSMTDIEKLVKEAKESTGGLPPPPPAPAPSDKDLKRFGQPVTNELLQDVSNKSFSAATKKKVLWAVCIFNQWKCIRNYKLKVDKTLTYPFINTTLVNMDLPTMCDVLCIFVMEIRKQNGDEYPRKTLYKIVLSIQNFLCMKGHNIKLLEHIAFTKLRNTVDNKMKLLSKADIIRPKKQAWSVSLE